MPKASIAHIEDIEKKLFWVFMSGLVFTMLLYGFLVNATVMNIVARKDGEQKIQMLHSHIGELESQYLALSSTITPEYARTLGFAENKKEDFASRKLFTYNVR